MSDDDPLDGAEDRLRALDDRSLAEHADVLEEVHQLLVAELDRLDGGAETPGRAVSE